MFEDYYSICLIFFKTTYWTMSPKRPGAEQHKMEQTSEGRLQTSPAAKEEGC
jgi:hypothetical protein